MVMMKDNPLKKSKLNSLLFLSADFTICRERAIVISGICKSKQEVRHAQKCEWMLIMERAHKKGKCSYLQRSNSLCVCWHPCVFCSEHTPALQLTELSFWVAAESCSGCSFGGSRAVPKPGTAPRQEQQGEAWTVPSEHLKVHCFKFSKGKLPFST